MPAQTGMMVFRSGQRRPAETTTGTTTGRPRQMSSTAPVLGPRGQFAERFALLYAEAGEPPLKRVTESVARARKVDDRGRPVRGPARRVSDWRRGRNVPARFAALQAALEVLVGEARKLRPAPVVEGLYDLAAWRQLWEQALASPVLP